MSQIIELLKSINYQVSKELLFNYKTLNITDSELIILIYLINQTSNTYNPKQIRNDLKLELDCQDRFTLLCEDSINISAKVFNHGTQITSATVTYTVNTDVKNDCYNISQIGNEFTITNLKQTYKPLIIDFAYNNLHKQIEITLGGYF